MTKKYVITDPCYILPEDIWDECCKKCEARGQENWSENFDGIVQEALRDFTQGQAFASSTGYGDWSNTIWGPNVDGTGSFCADSGMVCVCELIGKVADALGNSFDTGCAASFEAEGPIKVDFDTSESDWTVVNIEDANGDCWHTDVPYDEEDEE